MSSWQLFSSKAKLTMPDMKVTASSPKIGSGLKKLGFKCGCVMFGKVRKNPED